MSNWDCKKQVDVVILDFAKAYDTVPHRNLLNKLQFYGINGNIHQWISSILMNRDKCVIVDGQSSSSVHVQSGVPQGTVLGPLLFLLHINDLPNEVRSTVRLFADDCLLYRVINSQQDQTILQDDLTNLERLRSKWGMKFNAQKCSVWLAHVSH